MFLVLHTIKYKNIRRRPNDWNYLNISGNGRGLGKQFLVLSQEIVYIVQGTFNDHQLMKGYVMGLFGKGKIFDKVDKITGAHHFSIQGKTITCPHCGTNRFEMGSALLNTAGMTFFNLDWANKQAAVLTCVVCTRIQWFLHEPEVID